MSEELKTCPFCGGDAEIVQKGTRCVSMIISCMKCGATLESNETWIDENSHWNTRHFPVTQEDAMADMKKLAGV